MTGRSDAGRVLTPAFVVALCCLAFSASAGAAEPKLTVAKTRLAAALKCSPGIDRATRTPIMLVTGTGTSGDEAYGIGKPAFDLIGAPVCRVNFPNNTTADMQVSVEYLVYGLRTMARRSGRPVMVFGISQGGLLPRVALTYWPSLRRVVSDVVSAAGTHHGTTVGAGSCGHNGVTCIPAGFQQAAGSNFLKALNRRGRDETPGPTSWTTVRSATDGTVQPSSGPRPSPSLRGATNVLIQDICPGRQVSHVGTALDSVTFALAIDALNHRGPARLSRLPGDVCAHPYAPGLNEALTTTILQAAGALMAGRGEAEPRVAREPRLRAWMRRAG
ncbi:unannotated protein [freshwater metagenome]|uniref:Unannotated protein n=1 Tax=freshwater metagenome TaxID=449393 RepID=A0A6J7D4G2_9ZZZZ|nr:hypothetical protein [Actinomycetota bacterium]